MHFDDFKVEVGAEDFGRLAGQPKKGVYPDAVVRGEDERDLGRSLVDLLTLGNFVSGCADDEDFAGLCAGFGHLTGDVGGGKVDDGITPGERGREIVVRIDGGGHFKFRIFGGAADESLAHAALGSVDAEAERRAHERRPRSARVARMSWRFSSAISTRGRRTSGERLMVRERAYLVGEGLLSIKRFLKSG